LIQFAGYGYTFWAPGIVRETLRTSYAVTGMILGCVGVVTSVVMLVVGRSSDRTGERPLHIAGSALALATGYFGAAVARHSVIGLLFFFLVAPGAMSLYGPFWALCTGFLRGRTAAGGIALISSVSNIGAFLSPIFVGQIRDHTGSFGAAHLGFAVAAFTAALIAIALRQPAPLITPARATS
jgi:predicted MFS family arabinose efflux permease